MDGKTVVEMGDVLAHVKVVWSENMMDLSVESNLVHDVVEMLAGG